MFLVKLIMKNRDPLNNNIDQVRSKFCGLHRFIVSLDSQML